MTFKVVKRKLEFDVTFLEWIEITGKDEVIFSTTKEAKAVATLHELESREEVGIKYFILVERYGKQR